MNLKINKGVVFLILCFLVLGGAVYFTYKKSTSKTPVPPLAAPTHTPEELKIISEIETKTVVITDSGVAPPVLEIKAHDQVKFDNRSSNLVNVKGEGWGDVPIAPGENLTQSFKTSGRFPYSVVNTSFSGEIVVK